MPTLCIRFKSAASANQSGQVTKSVIRPSERNPGMLTNLGERYPAILELPDREQQIV
jgi:hypothetical protein